MSNPGMDSPLSITASVAGILTLLAAVTATLYIRLTYLRNADVEYFRVKASLSWFKTESTFMSELISNPNFNLNSGGDSGREKEMFQFVVEDLKRLEVRLLEVVEEAEGGRDVEVEKGKKKDGWTVVPGAWRGKTDIAMGWLPVRAKALELVRQRDALGSRVLFAQMSMISSKVKDQEASSKLREEKQRERLESLESKLDRLEDLVSRVMFRDRTMLERQESELTRYEEGIEPSGIETPKRQFLTALKEPGAMSDSISTI